MASLFAEAEALREHGFGYPAHVRREFERYLSCGVLAHGFVRIACETNGCRFERLVAYSCKGRCICPSCVARRMADGAAHLVDHVLPVAPYRQWTLSLPYRVRHRIGFHKATLSKVLSIYLRSLFAWQRLQARREGISQPLTGAVTLCQRFGSLLQFTPHFHSWLPDGVFQLTSEGTLGFHRLAPPQDRDIEALVTRIAQRIERYLDVADEADVDEEQATLSQAADSPLLPSLSVVVPPKPLCASLDGYSLHDAALCRLNPVPGRPDTPSRRSAYSAIRRFAASFSLCSSGDERLVAAGGAAPQLLRLQQLAVGSVLRQPGDQATLTREFAWDDQVWRRTERQGQGERAKEYLRYFKPEQRRHWRSARARPISSGGLWG